MSARQSDGVFTALPPIFPPFPLTCIFFNRAYFPDLTAFAKLILLIRKLKLFQEVY